jgi:multiple sugar transport system permease protein
MTQMGVDASVSQQLSGIVGTKKQRDTLVGFAFLLPFLFFYVAFTLYPIVYGFWISLHNWEIVGTNIKYLGLQNYERVLEDKLFWESLENTVLFVVLTIPIMLLALLFAIALNREIRGIGIFRTFIYVPNVLSVAVIGIIWARIFASDPRGLINALLEKAGMEIIPWLNRSDLAMPAVAIATTWWTVGFNTLIFLAGLQSIDEELYDAAKVDGANGPQRFLFITIPSLRRTIAFVSILQIIASFQIFGQVDIMTRGGPAGHTRTIVYYIWQRAFDYWQLGYGAAMGFLLFILLFAISMIQLWYFREKN